MKLQLEAMALAMPEVAEHPNRLAFRGVLTLVGVAVAAFAGGGARASRDADAEGDGGGVAVAAGDGAGLFAGDGWHDVRRKIGIITEAEIVRCTAEAGGAGQLAVSGLSVSRRTFPR